MLHRWQLLLPRRPIDPRNSRSPTLSGPAPISRACVLSTWSAFARLHLVLFLPSSLPASVLPFLVATIFASRSSPFCRALPRSLPPPFPVLFGPGAVAAFLPFRPPRDSLNLRACSAFAFRPRSRPLLPFGLRRFWCSPALFHSFSSFPSLVAPFSAAPFLLLLCTDGLTLSLGTCPYRRPSLPIVPLFLLPHCSSPSLQHCVRCLTTSLSRCLSASSSSRLFPPSRVPPPPRCDVGSRGWIPRSRFYAIVRTLFLFLCLTAVAAAAFDTASASLFPLSPLHSLPCAADIFLSCGSRLVFFVTAFASWLTSLV